MGMKNLGPRPKLFLSTSFDIRRRVINHSECVAGGSSNDNDPPLNSPKCIYIYIYISRDSIRGTLIVPGDWHGTINLEATQVHREKHLRSRAKKLCGHEGGARNFSVIKLRRGGEGIDNEHVGLSRHSLDKGRSDSVLATGHFSFSNTGKWSIGRPTPIKTLGVKLFPRGGGFSSIYRLFSSCGFVVKNIYIYIFPRYRIFSTF